tara:strand:+ start:13840 stop:14391 length:552 start_codon:yes stop_codon:yes gene_type:complete
MKKVVFTFGRFNPPTIGHEKLIRAVEKEAGSADWLIIASQSVDAKKNPLPYEYKVEVMKKMFPFAEKHIDDGACCKTPIDVMKHLMMKEYTDVVMVVGSDRVGAMKFVKDYNRKDDYSFNTVEIANAGQRDPDADGATGMSASKMREAAKNSSTTEFLTGIPDTMSIDDKLKLMAEVRKGMGL